MLSDCFDIYIFVFIYVWMITSSLGFMYTEACWTCVSFFSCLFDCWLWVTEMGWPGVGTVSSHLPVWKQCFQIQFGMDVFPKCLCEDCWQPNNCLYYVCFFCVFCYGVLFVFCCVMALGHYMREKSAMSNGTSAARKHPRKRCEMPPRKHAIESA